MLNLITSTLIAQIPNRPNEGPSGVTNSNDSSVFGEIKPPPGVDQYNIAADGIGLILFVSRVIRLLTVVAGIYVLFNVILAGYIYISSSGDSSAHQKVRDQLTFSIIGLLIIVGSYTIAGIVGLILFGDATFIINPTICGPDGC